MKTLFFLSIVYYTLAEDLTLKERLWGAIKFSLIIAILFAPG